MSDAIQRDLLYKQMLAADEVGIRLEMVMGQPMWEFHPSPLHQKAVRQIVRSIQPTGTSGTICGCFDLSDAYIVFPDGSFKRPDVSIFCEEPPSTQEALTVVPEAVIEIVSPGSERKDLDIGPPFYLSQGVKDVIVFDPRTLAVLHHRRNGLVRHLSPATIELECGCTVTA